MQLCERLGVRLLVDAEYTYLNPALRLLSLAAMMTYNTRAPLVAYTYQNYLKVTPVSAALTHYLICVFVLLCSLALYVAASRDKIHRSTFNGVPIIT